MDLDHKLGTILCDSCGAKYSMRINRLTDPIDVYSEWIDSAPPQTAACTHHALDFLFHSTLPLFLRAVSDAINQPGGSGVAARAPQRSENERDGETEWHGEEEGSGGED